MFECLEEHLRNVINTKVGLVDQTNKHDEEPLQATSIKRFIDAMAPPSAVLGKFAFLITNETHKKGNESLVAESRVDISAGGHCSKGPATDVLQFTMHLDLDSLIFSHLLREYEKQWDDLDGPPDSTRRRSSTNRAVCPNRDNHQQYACEKAKGADAFPETCKSCGCFCSSAADSRFWDFVASTKTLEIATYVRECIISLAKNAQELLSIVPSSRAPPRASIPDGKPVFDNPNILPFSLSLSSAKTGSEKKVPHVNSLEQSNVASASASSDSRYLQIVVHTAIGTDLRLFEGFFGGSYPMDDNKQEGKREGEVKNTTVKKCTGDCNYHSQKIATTRRPALSHANNAIIARAIRVGIEEATAEITATAANITSATKTLPKPTVGKKDVTALSSWQIKIETRVVVRRSDTDIVKSVASAHVSSRQQKASDSENNGSRNSNGGETKERSDFWSETDLCALLEPIPRAIPRHFTSLFSAMSSAACCDEDLTATKSSGWDRPHIVVTAHFGVASAIASQRNDYITNSSDPIQREVLVFDSLEWATSSSLSPSATATDRDRSENTCNPPSNSATPLIGSLGRSLLASTSSSYTFKERREDFCSLIPKTITCHFLIENLFHEAFALVNVTVGEENGGGNQQSSVSGLAEKQNSKMHHQYECGQSCGKGVLMSIFHPRQLPARVSQRLLSHGHPGSFSQGPAEIQSLIFDCIVAQCKEVLEKEQAALELAIRGRREGEEGRGGDGVDNMKVDCRATDTCEHRVVITKAVLGWAKGKLRFIRGASSLSKENFVRSQPNNNAQTFSLLLRAQTELLEMNHFIMQAHKEKMRSKIVCPQSAEEKREKRETTNSVISSEQQSQILSSTSVVENSRSDILRRIQVLSLATSSILNGSDLHTTMSLCEIFFEHAMLGSKNNSDRHPHHRQVFATHISADMLVRKLLLRGQEKSETPSPLDAHSLAILDKVCGLRGLGLWALANCDTTTTTNLNCTSSPIKMNSIGVDGAIPSNPLLITALCSHRKYRVRVDTTGRRADLVGETTKDAKVIANSHSGTASSAVPQENKFEFDVGSMFLPCRQALLEYWRRLHSQGEDPSASFSPPSSLTKEILTKNKDVRPSLFFSISEEEERPNLSLFENDVNDLLLIRQTEREMSSNSRAGAEMRTMNLPNGRLGAVLSVPHPSERRRVERENQLYSSLQIAAVSIGLLSVCRHISEAEAYLMMAAVTASTFEGTFTRPSSSPLIWPLHTFGTENNPQSRGGRSSISILAPPSSARLWHLVTIFMESVGHCVLVDDSTNNFFASRTLKAVSRSGASSSRVLTPLIGKLLEIDFDTKISNELSNMDNVKFVSSEIDEVSEAGEQPCLSSASSVRSTFDDWWEGASMAAAASASRRTIARFFGSDKSLFPADTIEFADELLSEALQPSWRNI